MSDRLFYTVICIGIAVLAYGWGYIHGQRDDRNRR